MFSWSKKTLLKKIQYMLLYAKKKLLKINMKEYLIIFFHINKVYFLMVNIG